MQRGAPEQDIDELRRQQQADQDRREERQMAEAMAQAEAQERGAAAPGYWSVIGEPDIGRDEAGDEHIEEFLKTEFSDKFALGNLTYEDYKSKTWQIENEFWLVSNEFSDPDSNLDDIDIATMEGQTRPTMTNERRRRLRSAMQAKKQMTSLSVGARGLRSGTEIHAVAKTEETEEPEDEGALSSIKNRLV